MKLAPLVALVVIGAVEGAERRSNIRGGSRDRSLNHVFPAPAADASKTAPPPPEGAAYHEDKTVQEAWAAYTPSNTEEVYHASPADAGYEPQGGSSGYVSPEDMEYKQEMEAAGYVVTSVGDEAYDPAEYFGTESDRYDYEDAYGPASVEGQVFEAPPPPGGAAYRPSNAGEVWHSPADAGEEEVLEAPPPPGGAAYRPSNAGEVWHSPADAGEEEVLEAPPPPGGAAYTPSSANEVWHASPADTGEETILQPSDEGY